MRKKFETLKKLQSRWWNPYSQHVAKSVAIGFVAQTCCIGTIVLLSRMWPFSAGGLQIDDMIQRSWSPLAISIVFFYFNFEKMPEFLRTSQPPVSRLWVYTVPIATTFINLGAGWPQRLQLWGSVFVLFTYLFSNRD
jgi:hypothetical protein